MFHGNRSLLLRNFGGGTGTSMGQNRLLVPGYLKLGEDYSEFWIISLKPKYIWGLK
jgi:hypothetical protein